MERKKLMSIAVWILLLGLSVLWSGCASRPLPSGEWTWTLGVQPAAEQTRPFRTAGGHDSAIVLQIRQRHVGPGSVQYALIRVDGQRSETVGTRTMTGDTDAGTWTEVAFPLPPGDGTYRLQVYNYGSCLCNGEVKMQTPP